MLITAGTPDEISRNHLSLVVYDAPFQHVRLLNLYVFVQWQARAGRPAEQRGEKTTFLVLQQVFSYRCQA
ncbi:hypothetical protein PPS11_02848 [Pseudomonas putida S11]|nr:hypothetical protein PPS11_02848 [Pseudomonas putida S11]